MAKTVWKNFKIKSKFKQEKQSKIHKDFTADRHNRIKVTNLDNGMEVKFDFWSSKTHPEVKTREDLLSAFGMFLSDGLDAEMSLINFANEFGYNTDVGLAVKVYKACKKALKKIRILFNGDINKAYDTLNALIDFENNGYEEG